ncbi:MAG: hypothetical protein Q9217_002059 [Psora testacea]
MVYPQSSKFPGDDPEYDQGTCNDALTARCASDLQHQAHTELTTILRNSQGNSSTAVCSSLSDSLRDKPPISCSTVNGGDWGTILARPLTGTNASQPLKPGNCHPMSGKGYNLTLVAVNRVNTPSRYVTDIKPVLFGITPLMTVIYGDQMRDPQVDLSCLKTIGPKRDNNTKKDSGTSGGSEGISAVLLLGIVVLSVIFSGVFGGLA